MLRQSGPHKKAPDRDTRNGAGFMVQRFSVVVWGLELRLRIKALIAGIGFVDD